MSDDTIKMVVLVRRRPDLTRDQFAAYWLGTHAPMAAGQGMLGYRVNVAEDPQPEGATAPWDGTAEIIWRSVEHMAEAMASEVGVLAAADVEHFAEHIEYVVTREHVVVPLTS